MYVTNELKSNALLFEHTVSHLYFLLNFLHAKYVNSYFF